MFYDDTVRGEDSLLAIVRDDLSGLTLVAPAKAADSLVQQCRGQSAGASASASGAGAGAGAGAGSGSEALAHGADASSLEWSPSPWRGFEIRMGQGAEVPGVISLVSDVLASRGISILNFSTNDSDIVLVKVRGSLSSPVAHGARASPRAP